MWLRRVLVLAVVTAGCGWRSADEQLLTIFFEQSRINDLSRVGNVATVVFDPGVEGVVERFRIVNRTDEALSDHRVRRQARLETHVRSAGREYDRTLLVTLERDPDGRWMITRFRWMA